MRARHREEVLNTVLAIVIGGRGMEADPETILERGRSRPDVMANFQGLRCALEGKFDDTAQAKAKAFSDARGRVEQAIAHVAIAVIYPADLRDTVFAKLPKALGSSELEFRVLTDTVSGEWHAGGVNEILAELRRAHDVIVRDDVLQQSVNMLEIGLQQVGDALMGSAATCDRLIRVLGVGYKSDAPATD